MERELEVVVREYDPNRDLKSVEEVERRCEASSNKKVSVFIDLVGDPLCKIRNSPPFIMLVAEMGTEKKEIVGMIRGCIKTVTCGKRMVRNDRTNRNARNDAVTVVPVYTKLAFVLGLRVSPSYRRMGLGLELVRSLEEWLKRNGAEYAYMTTENDNHASINLFVGKFGYTRFRTPLILVNPVFAHLVSVSDRVTIIKLDPSHAELLYRRRFSTTEFFPRDIDSVLNNKLSLGSFLAVPRGTYSSDYPWPGSDEFLSDPPESWAVLSIWNTKDVFRLEVCGALRTIRALAWITRVIDKTLPFLKIPSVPDVFRPFGLHFLYGLGGEGPEAERMVTALCGHAHNVAKEHGCGVLAAEVLAGDPLQRYIPHWNALSISDNIWCIKRLQEDYSDGDVGDWTKSSPGLSIFVDPREI